MKANEHDIQKRMLELERMIHAEHAERLWYNLDIGKSYNGYRRAGYWTLG